MTPSRLFGFLAALTAACAVGVSPDTHDTGFVVESDRGRPLDAGFPEDLGEPKDTAVADDEAAVDDLDDAADTGLFVDLPRPVDVAPPMDTPAPVDLPPTDLGCGALPGSCVPGTTQPCGHCGMQLCGAGCTWSACMGQGVCAAGTSRTQPCGNCGAQSQRCSAACAWESVGSCAGSGPCAPGATQGGGCDPCSQQVCQSNCNWGGCALRGGSACEYQAGRNHRACGACRCGLQFCLNSCQWSTSCVSCCTSCGGCL